MRNPSRQQLLRQLSLWLLGQALPKTDALRQPLRYGLMGMMVASVAGTLLALSVAVGMAALHYTLVAEGLRVSTSLALVAGIGVLLGLLAYGIARRRVDVIPDTLDELQLFSGHRPGDMLGELVSMVVNGFVEGAADTAEKVKKTAARSRDDIEEAIEALIDELDALEESAAALEKEADEVVLDIERHAPAAKTRRRKPANP